MTKRLESYKSRHFEAVTLSGKRAEVYFYLGRFLARQMLKAYHWSGGDLVSVVVFGEIGLHSASGSFKPGHRADRAPRASALLPSDRNLADMPACNVHSLSRSLGIPRETVRRKTEELLSRGWIDKDARGGLRITVVGLRALEAHHSVELLDGFFDAADAIFPILGASPGGEPAVDNHADSPPTECKRSPASSTLEMGRTPTRKAPG